VFDSTNAALGLLERLNKRFDGNWLHALAAYNAGPARISVAMRRNAAAGRSTDYWDLELPRETDNYVPRLLALAEIIARPEDYGIELPDVPNKPRLDRIDAGERTDLRVAARVAGVDKDELLRLNAGYKAMTTRPDGPHWIVVPVGAVDRLNDGLAKLDKDQRLPANDLKHRIARGETLGGIARRYGVSVAALKRANHLHGHLIRAGRKLLIPGRLETNPVAQLELSDASSDTASRIQHRVVKGDSLYLIARRYKVSIKQLRGWNDIQGKLIKPGQELTVFVRQQPLAL
jgi:membrane-bound lytic murein transglycosylase D